jgi:formylglycine-generating enzyme required for sulfatase activity
MSSKLICLSVCHILPLAMVCSTTWADPPPARTSHPLFVGKEAGEVRSDNNLKIKLNWCPLGQFLMGSPVNQPGHDRDEKQVEVTITRGFWLAQTECTQSQWISVMGTRPWRGDPPKADVKEGDDYPATYVSWNDAMAFCQRLTDAENRAGQLPEGAHYTLPTEAEWEYACRAGSTTRFCFGDDNLQLVDYAWFRVRGVRNRDKHPQPVARKKPNHWGFFDMHGNVSEWCRDLYAAQLPGGINPDVRKAPPQPGLAQFKAKFPREEVEDSPGGTLRVSRGGAWLWPDLYCRSAFRTRSDPSPQNWFTGFRVALERANK